MLNLVRMNLCENICIIIRETYPLTSVSNCCAVFFFLFILYALLWLRSGLNHPMQHLEYYGGRKYLYMYRKSSQRTAIAVFYSTDWQDSDLSFWFIFLNDFISKNMDTS